MVDMRVKVRGDRVAYPQHSAARSHYDRYYFIRRHDNWRGALASALASLGAATAATALADSVSRWVTLVLASCAVHSFYVVRSVCDCVGKQFFQLRTARLAFNELLIFIRSALSMEFIIQR